MNKGFVRISACAMLGAVMLSGLALTPTKAEAADYTVIPARKGITIIPAWKTNETEEPEIQEVTIREVTLHVEERKITGFIPSSNTNKETDCELVCPITEEEIVMLAKVLKRECGGITWNAYGMSGKARQAAVAWCALNRLDDSSFPDTLKGVLTYPGAFAWIPDTYVSDDLLELAHDVVNRWWSEKNGAEEVGRTLPANFFFFAGDGRENHFRTEYKSPFVYWSWDCEDPYTERKEVQE